MALSNNALRVIVSIFAIPVILAASYFGKLFFLILILLIALISYYEFCILVRNKEIYPNVWLGMFAVAFLVINQSRHFWDVYSFMLFFVVLLSVIELFRNKGSAIFNISSTLLGVFYIGLFSNAIIAIREFYPNVGDLYLNGGYLIISILATIWICDSAAYYGGTALGKHKLFPRVSPKKSWEGAIFGIVFSIITMILAKNIILNFLSWTNVILLGIIIGTIGQIGDLVESLIKRDAGVKDSSNIIPGHGGIFDRFDSLFFSAPVILLYLRYLA
jgi:phosphatidate cytidylyltransferase